MTTVLYADVLFIINFSMDFISLCLTAKILALNHRTLRYIASAAIGAIGATVMTAAVLEGLTGAFCTLLLSVVMTLIAYGYGSAGSFGVRTLSLWGTGALIGGLVSALCSLGEYNALNVSVGTPNRPWGFIAFGVLMAWGVLRVIRPKLGQRNAEVRLRLGARSVTAQALVDTGNLTVDPLSGDCVIFLSMPLSKKLFGEPAATLLAESRLEGLSSEFRNRVRVIPTSSIKGQSICSAVILDTVEILPDKTPRRALVAVVDVPDGHFGGCGVLLPALLA